MADELAARRRVQPAVRALRGRRPPGPRAPRRRRAEHRRCRAQRGRGRRLPGDRGGRPAAARGDGQRRQPGDGELRRDRPARGAAVHPAGRRSAAGTCPTCCAAATTPGSTAGGGRRRCTARCATAPTWSRRRRARAKMTAGCWKSSPPSPILDRSPALTCQPGSTERSAP